MLDDVFGGNLDRKRYIYIYREDLCDQAVRDQSNYLQIKKYQRLLTDHKKLGAGHGVDLSLTTSRSNLADV